MPPRNHILGGFYIYTVTITTKSPGDKASSLAGVGSGRSEVIILCEIAE